MTRGIMEGFERQEWIAVIEALAGWSRSPRNIGTAPEERACELISVIGPGQGYQPVGLLRQIDQKWAESSSRERPEG